jgi:NAD(P)H-hydrate epimerase
LLKIATAKQMQAIDRRAIHDCGIPGLILMENAGLSVVSALTEQFPDLKQKKVLVFCGVGNNGGDGFVIARYLHNQGVPVRAYLVGTRADLKDDARANAEIASRIDVPVQEIAESTLNAMAHDLRHCDIVVDAVFGTGLTRPAVGLHEKLFEKINAAGKYVAAVDIPSGIDSDSGNLIGPHIRANLTVALALLKRSHLLYPAAEAMGEIRIGDIGMPAKAIAEEPLTTFLIEEEDIRACFKKRPPDVHKGTFGHVLVIGGSRGKGGAAGLTALAALRIGAGLVTLAVPHGCAQALEFHPLEVMSVGLPETDTGSIDLAALDILLEQCRGKTAIALGPGLSTHPRTVELIRHLLPALECPTVIDADGLNALAQFPDLLKHLKMPVVLTPHPKEMSRLCGLPPEEILGRRLDTATHFAVNHNATVVLKSAHSTIACADGTAWINPRGNPGMATAGTGDVLTGMIAGLLGQGFDTRNAALCGAYIHGLCGDLYADENSQTTLIAGDLLRTLPAGLKRILP